MLSEILNIEVKRNFTRHSALSIEISKISEPLIEDVIDTFRTTILAVNQKLAEKN